VCVLIHSILFIYCSGIFLLNPYFPFVEPRDSAEHHLGNTDIKQFPFIRLEKLLKMAKLVRNMKGNVMFPTIKNLLYWMELKFIV
jgi:hypothetical protein